MPLPYPSTSHGTVPFGFFNIKTDLVLLRRDFFFADQLCRAIVVLDQGGAQDIEAWRIDAPEERGDLHGAIAGEVLSGFIGNTYRRWPFPPNRDEFVQDPSGRDRQDETRSLIERFASVRDMHCERVGESVRIGDILFSAEQFGGLVDYIDRGGMPRWADDRRPDYVLEMVEALRERGSPWFDAIER